MFSLDGDRARGLTLLGFLKSWAVQGGTHCVGHARLVDWHQMHHLTVGGLKLCSESLVTSKVHHQSIVTGRRQPPGFAVPQRCCDDCKLMSELDPFDVVGVLKNQRRVVEVSGCADCACIQKVAHKRPTL